MSGQEFSIGRVKFSSSRCAVIAEAGVDHLGDLGLARKLFEAAPRAGANIIIFQTDKAARLTTRHANRFWDWDGEESADGSQFDSYSQLNSFEEDDYRQVKAMCDETGIQFISTPFDIGAVDMLARIGVNGFKIASCDLTNTPLLEAVAESGLPTLLSTGASEIPEIERALEVLQSGRKPPVLLMHCTLTYPTPPMDANLRAISHLKQHFPDALVGLSDHTPGVAIGPASVVPGATAIEKHFTIDKELPLSADHSLSVDEGEMQSMVRAVRELEAARGDGVKRVLDSEKNARLNARRSVVYGSDYLPGHKLALRDSDFKRPGSGISPDDVTKLVGKVLKKAVRADDLVWLADFCLRIS